MNKILLAASVAAVTLAAAPAYAAPTIVISGAAGTFGDDDVGCAGGAGCGFTRSFSFATPTGYRLASATISSIMSGNNKSTDIKFTSVLLNGVAFSVLDTGVAEYQKILNRVLVPGATNTISVAGMTGGDGAFSGTLSFAAGAVPEPATWAMLILGFGVVGTGLRRQQRKVKTTVSFA